MVRTEVSRQYRSGNRTKMGEYRTVQGRKWTRTEVCLIRTEVHGRLSWHKGGIGQGPKWVGTEVAKWHTRWHNDPAGHMTSYYSATAFILLGIIYCDMTLSLIR